MQPLVSIIVPAFNAAPWLQETLDSAFAQTWPAIEVIVVDDGSTDETLAIARRYEGRGARIISQQNQGLSGARNAALAVARGEYIQFLDADDLISADKIEHQVALLRSAPPDTLATGRWGRFRRDVGKAVYPPSNYWRDLEPLEYMAHVAATGSTIPVHAWLLPRSIVEKIGPFAPELRTMEDHEYLARAVLASAGLRFTPHGVSYYRSFHTQSLSKQRASAAGSMFRSVELATGHILAHQGPPDRLRGMAADYYQWLVFKLYPDRLDLVERALGRVRELGGSKIRPRMGRRAEALARIIGWRAVQRMRVWLWNRGIYLSKYDFIAD